MAVVLSAQRETLDRILAVVAGQVIMQSDVRAFLELGLMDGVAQTDEAVLTYLIERRLVLDEVDRYVAANPPPPVVERRLELVAARFTSEAAFRDALARVGLTDDDLRQVLRDDARRDAYIENRFGAAGGAIDREALVAEWVVRLVRRGQVIRPLDRRGGGHDDQDLGGVEAGVADHR